MLLLDPFIISARLLPALRIQDLTISLDPSSFHFHLNHNGGTNWYHLVTATSGDLQECFVSLLNFLEHAGECYQLKTECDLFPPHVCQWACENQMAISEILSEIEFTDIHLIQE